MSLAVPPLSDRAIALNRFGLGVRPDDPVPDRPAPWLLGQFDRYQPAPSCLASLSDPGALLAQERDDRAAAPQRPDGTPHDQGAADTRRRASRTFAHGAHALYRDAVQARATSALQTDTPFVERLVHFWSNHFCVSADNARVAAFAGAFERDAIRPHVLGRFADLLLAVERHPAMLIYLNQTASIGPDSPRAHRIEARDPTRRAGLNENLGREILELHTLGVRSGYTQRDVTEFARALTGWSVDGIGPGHGAREDADPDRFVFRAGLHEPGTRIFLGRGYPQEGEDQAAAMLLDVAQSGATATHVATALASHFAGDTPPPALVARLASVFRRTGGDLPSVYHALVASPEPWSPAPLKFKTPWDWTISALRGLGRADPAPLDIAPVANALGQPVWRPGSPAGWDDTEAGWAAPDALMRRVEFAARLAAPAAATRDARALGPVLIPGSLSPDTATGIARAESPTSALALLLVSPDFLRR